MSDIGYLYVLANSAMPGLVKVGKTTRTPSERAGELSGVTGIPTPFLVIFEQLFQDCHIAESFVHTYLSQKGHRVSDSREFFNAPANIVIRAIGLAPGAIDDDAPTMEAAPRDELIESHAPDELDSLTIPEPEPAWPWMDIFLEALAHYHGADDYLQDNAEAMRLFRQAAILGAIPAYGYIGRMYENGEGVTEDVGRALEIYKEGARKGNVYCDWAMGMLFLRQSKYENSEKCFSRFARNKLNLPPHNLGLMPNDMNLICESCVPRLMAKTIYYEEEGMEESHESMWSDFRESQPNFYGLIVENSQGIARSTESHLKLFEIDSVYAIDLNKLLRLLPTLH